MVGLTERTVQRWVAQGGGDDLRRGPKSTPRNKLTAAEEQQVLAVANSPEFHDVSPRQIVPTLRRPSSTTVSFCSVVQSCDLRPGSFVGGMIQPSYRIRLKLGRVPPAALRRHVASPTGIFTHVAG